MRKITLSIVGCAVISAVIFNAVNLILLSRVDLYFGKVFEAAKREAGSSSILRPQFEALNRFRSMRDMMLENPDCCSTWLTLSTLDEHYTLIYPHRVITIRTEHFYSKYLVNFSGEIVDRGGRTLTAKDRNKIGR